MKLWVLFALLFSSSVFALELDAAKSSGLVGEGADGYLAVMGSQSPDVVTLVEEINQKRKVHYRRIAIEQKTPLENIEKIAGEKLIARSKAEGTFHQSVSGDWVK